MDKEIVLGACAGPADDKFRAAPGLGLRVGLWLWHKLNKSKLQNVYIPTCGLCFPSVIVAHPSSVKPAQTVQRSGIQLRRAPHT